MQIFDLMITQKSSLLFKITCKDRLLYVSYQRRDIELAALCQEFNQRPDLIKALVNQFEFYTFLCYGRNYVCSKYVNSVFSFDLLLGYLKNSAISNDIKASLLLIIVHCHLDERPRFKENLPALVYSLRTQKDERRDGHPLISKKSLEVIEMVRLNNPNKIEERSIKELLTCVSLEDNLSRNQIAEIKAWTLSSIESFLETTSIEHFYDRLNEVSLYCLRHMIQLKMFSSGESDGIQQTILHSINKLKQSMEHKGEVYHFQS